MTNQDFYEAEEEQGGRRPIIVAAVIAAVIVVAAAWYFFAARDNTENEEMAEDIFTAEEIITPTATPVPEAEQRADANAAVAGAADEMSDVSPQAPAGPGLGISAALASLAGGLFLIKRR